MCKRQSIAAITVESATFITIQHEKIKLVKSFDLIDFDKLTCFENEYGKNWKSIPSIDDELRNLYVIL